MNADWQTILAILIVALAAIALIKRLFGRGNSSSCGSGCDGCSSSQSNPKQLFQLDGEHAKRKN